MIFPAGTRIRRISDPGMVDITTGETQTRATYSAVEVLLPDGVPVWWHAHHVEEAPIQVRRLDAFRAGRFGRVEDLRRTLMVEKIRGEFTDGQCQTNANQTAKCAKRIASGRQLTPLGQGGRTVLFEDLAAVEVTVVVEVVVDRGVGGCKFL